MPKEKVYFQNLDAIRFIAALMVYFEHGLTSTFQYLPIKNTFWEPLLHAISSGGTGVSMFFVLSGFLITFLLISEYELNSKISVWKFYLRRILRIWPLYFSVIAFTFLIYPFLKSLIGMNNPLCSDIKFYITFLSNFDVMNILRHCQGNSAMSQDITWSVAIEEQFYLFWPLLFVFLPKKFWLHSIILITIGSIYFRILHYTDGIILYFHTFSVLLDLSFGGLMALLVKENKKFREFFENSSTLTHLLFFVISFSLILWNKELFNYPYGAAVSRVFISFSLSLMICAQAITNSASKLNLRNFSFATKWGKYTYGIYLIHPIILTLLDVSIRVLHIPKTNLLCALMTGITGFIITLAVSKFSFIHFESRFLKLKEKFTNIKHV